MIQQFIHTIAKEEIAKLTVEEFKGRIITILSKEEADKAVEYLLRFPIVGFDTETRPSFKKGQRYKISLMQISTDDTCFLFRLNHIGIPESLEKFLKSSSTLKIGLSLRDDFGAIRKRSDIEPANFLDLQNYVGQFGIEDASTIAQMSLLAGEQTLENTGKYGTAKINSDDKTVTYTLHNTLDSTAAISLFVKFTNDPAEQPTVFSVNIIPATSVYYEDSFATFKIGRASCRERV